MPITWWSSLLLFAATASCFASICSDSETAAKKYLKENYHFERINERTLALSNAGLHESLWEDESFFFPTVRFLYFLTSVPSQTYELLAVLPDCSTRVINGEDAIGDLIAEQLREPTSDQERIALARLLLRMLNVSNIYGQGYDDGVNIIESLEDITFKSDEEWNNVQEQVRIVPPSLETTDHGFTYSFYSWERKGNGHIYHSSIEYRVSGDVGFSRELVLQSVGLWKPLR